jgi:ribosomal protein S18 acetylase RimI-like enzyme
MSVHVREATPADAARVAELVRELGTAEGDQSPVDDAGVLAYLAYPGSGILVAELGDRVVGALTWFTRPGLYHGGPWGYVDELIVTAQARGGGVGDALLSEVMDRFGAAGCREVSVSTMPDNEPAKALYRKHGLVDEALLLERHFPT